MGVLYLHQLWCVFSSDQVGPIAAITLTAFQSMTVMIGGVVIYESRLEPYIAYLKLLMSRGDAAKEELLNEEFFLHKDTPGMQHISLKKKRRREGNFYRFLPKI